MSDPRDTTPGTPEATPEHDDQAPAAGRSWLRRFFRGRADQTAAPDHPRETDPQPAAPAPATTVTERPAPARREPRKTKRTARTAPPPPVADRSGWAILGVAVVGLLVLAIVGVGLYASLGALRDTAVAAHMEPDAARVWWIGIDGLIVVAIVAAMILRHDPVARWYALGIVMLFTAASGLLQFLHGRGLTTLAGRSGAQDSLPWPVVAVIALLVIGTIFCGTHLFVYVLRHLFPRALADQHEYPASGHVETSREATEPRSTEPDTGDGSPDESRSEPPLLDPETEREIRKWFAACAVHLILDAGGKPTRTKIARSFEIPDRQAGYVIADVTADREEAAQRAAQFEAAAPAGTAPSRAASASNGSAVAP